MAEDLLDRGVEQGIITHEQADALRGLEAADGPQRGERRGLLGELLGYVGAALATAAAFLVIGEFWEDLAPAARAVVVASGAILLAIGGWTLREHTEGAGARLASVLWAGTCGLTLAFGFVLGMDVLDGDGDVVALWTALGTAAVAALLWSQRRNLLLLALIALPLFMAGIAVNELFGPEVGVSALLVVGIAWVLAGLREILVPAAGARVIGGVLMLASPTFGGLEWAFVVGLVAAVGLVALGAVRDEFPLLGVGSVGVLLWVPVLVSEWFGETIAVPLALLVVGLGLVAVALRVSRSPKA